MFGRRTGLLSLRSGRLACDDALTAAVGRLLCKSRLHLFPLYTDTVFRRVVSPAPTALLLFARGTKSAGEFGAPDATHQVVYPQL